MALAKTGPARKLMFQSVELLKDETLGIGSYGKVCKARCDNLVCAAKILHPTFFGTNDPGARMFVEKFQQECEFMLDISHPNVVQCLGVSEDVDGPHCAPVLLLELMDESLTHFLERSKEPLPYFTEVTISHDVALALSFLHSNGYIHCDLSSNNILLIAGTRAKVADFNMHRFSNGKYPCKSVYMPPEAAKNFLDCTEMLDTFSFGVVLVQIMTRLFPDPGPSREPDTEGFVPETKRREDHIELVQEAYPLLPIALHCLNDIATERPTAANLCDWLESLKNSEMFIANKAAEQCVSVAFFQRKQLELRYECIKTSQIREKEIVERLSEIATKRESELIDKFTKLKMQDDTLANDSNQPSSLEEQKSVRHDSFLESLRDWNLPSKINGKASLTPNKKTPLSHSMSDGHLIQNTQQRSTSSANAKAVHRPPNSASAIQGDYYNIHSLTMQQGTTLVSKKCPSTMPRLAQYSEEEYVIPDTDPDSMNFGRQVPKLKIQNDDSDDDSDFEYSYPYMDHSEFPSALPRPHDYEQPMAHPKHVRSSTTKGDGVTTRQKLFRHETTPTSNKSVTSGGRPKSDQRLEDFLPPNIHRPTPKPRKYTRKT